MPANLLQTGVSLSEPPTFFPYFKLHFQDNFWEVLRSQAYLIHTYVIFSQLLFPLPDNAKISSSSMIVNL